MARLPELRSRVETGLIATAFDQYRPCFPTAGIPALDRVRSAVQLWLLLDIYGLASRQSEVFSFNGTGHDTSAPRGARTAGENTW